MDECCWCTNQGEMCSWLSWKYPTPRLMAISSFSSDKSGQWQWLSRYPPVLYRFQARGGSVPSLRAGLHTNPRDLPTPHHHAGEPWYTMVYSTMVVNHPPSVTPLAAFDSDRQLVSHTFSPSSLCYATWVWVLLMPWRTTNFPNQ